MSDKTPRPGQQHPQEWRRDLNPDALAGQNTGATAGQAGRNLLTAYDLKDVHRALRDIPDDALKQIPVLPPASGWSRAAPTSTWPAPNGASSPPPAIWRPARSTATCPRPAWTTSYGTG